MSLYENRVRIAEEVKEQEALRKKYEIEENVIVIIVSQPAGL